MVTKSNFGFTLVELIVVITIIGLLATVGIGSYTNVQKNSSRYQETSRHARIC
ncbi:hypothetical protein CO051_00270 [Candidatus Roizmanbacteria bacterium CG_4_9_14_0_2_um_filter_39_13]|uniref:Prepilin-type cleavage/methylation domain-containing protein n=1 Tax=Candidatus Roizmanbacteria bacterium CG_4_9_14_0_2_um_filter_39_13 TaxID=1974839 RepID=A0A2M8F4L2_9BACT|nr:MAG: hypothetical protein CO051_00270 [Candidatus Roizmanbacteria bacterium CG_4_9_14_0_2_um_filter_39_13]